MRWPSVLSLLLLTGCADRPIGPVTENPFAERIWLINRDTNEPIDDEIVISPGAGFPMEIGLVAKTPRPETLEGRPVKPHEEWPIAINIYPRETEADSADAWLALCNPANPRAPITPFVGSMLIWQDWGLQQPPKFDRLDEPEARRWWTFAAVRSMEPAEYVYEVTVFPTCFWISDVRYDAGPRVVLKRGLLRVVEPKTSQSVSPDLRGE